INSRVVSALRDRGRDVAYCRDAPGQDDRAVLLRAELEGRVVLTHDSDMGTLVLREPSGVSGVIYLRPAHTNAEFTTETLAAMERTVGNVDPGFVIVGDRRGEQLRVRLRRW